MLTSKKTALKPLLESFEGIHLTAYLVNKGDLVDLKSQLRDVMSHSYEWLNPVMTSEERNKFLEPLEALLLDARIFRQMKGNIGIFRNKDLFRVLNIPIDIEQSCQVATSFHVKPLLRWLQNDQEFLLLGLNQDSAYLYLGSQTSLKLIDANEIINTDLTSKEEEIFSWLNEMISKLTRNSTPKLFMAGEKKLVQRMYRNLKYANAVTVPIADDFHREKVGEICTLVRKILKSDSKNLIEKTLLEFRLAEEGSRARKNIFQIARAVVKGKVRKLIVTDELSIFGKIDLRTGGLSIHPFDLDHEDDCILDDLAQMVLSQGGEVLVASRDEIPKGRPILAILDDEGTSLEKTEDLQYQILQERFG